MNLESKNKNLLKGTGLYAIGTFGTKILSFLIVPLYTYYLLTEEMGVYDLLLSTVQLLTPLITLQISDAAYRWIIREEENYKVYVGNTINVLFVNCSIVAVLICIFNKYHTIPYYGYFIGILISSRFFSSFQKLLRGLKNQRLFVESGLLYTSIFLTLNVIYVCILNKGIIGLFESNIWANVISVVYIVIKERKIKESFFIKINFPVIVMLLRFSIPLVPNYLNWWVINSSDRYIVAFFLGTSANGILAVAHKFPSLLQTVLNLFNSSWQDVSVADTDENLGEYYTKVFKKYAVISLSILIPLIPFTKVFIYLVMGQNYKSACNYVSFYYLGTVYQSFASFYGVGYLKNKKTSKAFATSVYAAIINAIVNVSTIKIIGLHAAALSTFLGFGIMWLIRERQNREELGIRVCWTEILSLTMITIFICIVSNATNLFVNICTFALGFFFFMCINRKDLWLGLKFLKKKLK